MLFQMSTATIWEIPQPTRMKKTGKRRQKLKISNGHKEKIEMALTMERGLASLTIKSVKSK